MNKLGAMNLFVDLMLFGGGGSAWRERGTEKGIRNYDKNLMAGRLLCKIKWKNILRLRQTGKEAA
jgi:hypothetical protein